MGIVKCLCRPTQLVHRKHHQILLDEVLAAGTLLPGSPGSLVLQHTPGNSVFYRLFHSDAGLEERYVCRAQDKATLAAVRHQMAFQKWLAGEVEYQRRIGSLVAESAAGRILIELYNQKAYEAELTLIGRLALTGWLNTSGGTPEDRSPGDTSILPCKHIEFLASRAAMETSDSWPFLSDPDAPADKPGILFDAYGTASVTGTVYIPSGTPVASEERSNMCWSAHVVAYGDYLLHETQTIGILSGDHMIPAGVPAAARLVWYSIYTGANTDYALALAVRVADSSPGELEEAWNEAPKEMQFAIWPMLDSLVELARGHIPLLNELRRCRERKGCSITR